MTPDADRILTVVGEGRASGSPDRCDVFLAVQGRGPTAAEAVQAMTLAAGAVLGAARDSGVADADLQTTGLGVQESFRPGTSAPEGYVGHYSLMVTGRAVEEVGQMLSTVGAAGGDALRVNGLGLRFSDPEPLRRDARRRAVEDARRKAEDLAAAAGLGLGPVVGIEYSDSPAVPGAFPVVRTASLGPGGPVPIPVEAGSGQIAAFVTVRFALVG